MDESRNRVVVFVVLAILLAVLAVAIAAQLDLREVWGLKG